MSGTDTLFRFFHRKRATQALDRLDAEIARWYVDDGQLSERPVYGGPPTATALGWRQKRLAAVARLEAAGGRDPWPAVLRDSTEAQREGWKRRHARV